MYKRLLLLVCAAILSLVGTAYASPAELPPGSTVLTFDDVQMELWSAPVPAGYGGLTWDNFYVADSNYPPIINSGYRKGAVTFPNVAYNGSANPATISRAAPFDFIEGYFTSA